MKTRLALLSRLLALAFAVIPLAPWLQAEPFPPIQAAPEVTGIYVSSGNPKDYTELKADGTFFCHQQGSDFNGKYVIKGTKITLILADGNSADGTIKDKVITDNEGMRWIKN